MTTTVINNYKDMIDYLEAGGLIDHEKFVQDDVFCQLHILMNKAGESYPSLFKKMIKNNREEQDHVIDTVIGESGWLSDKGQMNLIKILEHCDAGWLDKNYPKGRKILDSYLKHGKPGFYDPENDLTGDRI